MGLVCVFSHPTHVYLYSRTLHRHIYVYTRTLHMHVCILAPYIANLYLYFRTLHMHISICMLAPCTCIFSQTTHLPATTRNSQKDICILAPHTCICIFVFSHRTHVYSHNLHTCPPQLEILKRIVVFWHPTHVYLYSHTLLTCLPRIEILKGQLTAIYRYI